MKAKLENCIHFRPSAIDLRKIRLSWPIAVIFLRGCFLSEPYGGKTFYDQIDSTIRVYDKLLLVLSDHSLNNEWVPTEIRRCRKAESPGRKCKLFPVWLVDMNIIQVGIYCSRFKKPPAGYSFLRKRYRYPVFIRISYMFPNIHHPSVFRCLLS